MQHRGHPPTVLPPGGCDPQRGSGQAMAFVEYADPKPGCREIPGDSRRGRRAQQPEMRHRSGHNLAEVTYMVLKPFDIRELVLSIRGGPLPVFERSRGGRNLNSRHGPRPSRCSEQIQPLRSSRPSHPDPCSGDAKEL